jgi:hypothetical protein
MKAIITTIALTMILALTASLAFAQPYHWSGNQRNTPGWQLMTPAERTEHQNKLRSFKDFDSCKAYADSHHNLMAERAKEKGIALRAVKRNPCEMMKQRGAFN